MQNFSELIKSEGQIKLYKQSRAKGISHLAYADDLMVFCKAREGSLTEVGKVFERFYVNTGLKVSNSKSTIHFSGSTRDKESLIRLLGYREGTFPIITYLGLHLSPRILNDKDCESLLNSIKAMIAGWKKKLLSYAGRV